MELRRFIAGAICPSCKGEDKLFIRSNDTQRICECIACGHREVMERADSLPAETTVVEPVRLIER